MVLLGAVLPLDMAARIVWLGIGDLLVSRDTKKQRFQKFLVFVTLECEKVKDGWIARRDGKGGVEFQGGFHQCAPGTSCPEEPLPHL